MISDQVIAKLSDYTVRAGAEAFYRSKTKSMASRRRAWEAYKRVHALSKIGLLGRAERAEKFLDGWLTAEEFGKRHHNLDVRTACRKCGWEFTVHTNARTMDTVEYRNCKWFCPHCGQEVPHGVQHLLL